MFEDQSEKVERAKVGLTKREALLKGELQAEGVRRLIGLEPQGEYPMLGELPETVFLPGEIIPRVVSMTRQYLKKGKEKECWAGFLNGKYWFSEVFTGSEWQVLDEHRNSFPRKRPDYLVLEIHTHKEPAERILPLPAPPDIAALLVSCPQLPAMLISSDSGAWLMIKGREYFEKPVPNNVESRKKAWEEMVFFVEESRRNLISSGEETLSAHWESLLAAILTRYGAAFYSSNPRYLPKGRASSKPILDLEQKVGMIRISGETHKKFLAE
jgi:hypothetical protein